MSRFNLPRAIALLIALLILAACDADVTPTPTPAPGQPTRPASAQIKPATPQPLPGSAAVGSGLIYSQGGAVLYLDPPHNAAGILVAAPNGQAVSAYALSADNRKLAYALPGNSLAAIWLLDLANTATPRHLVDVAGGGGPSPTLAFSPDGNRLAITTWDANIASGSLTALDLTAAQPKPQSVAGVHGQYIYSPIWSPDNRHLGFVQGEKSGGVGYNASILATDTVAASTVITVAQGNKLADSRLALPPLDPTWVDSDTMAFQEWNIAKGAQATWLADTTTPVITPRLLVSDQLGLATWSAAVNGSRLLAYRVPGDGLYVSDLSKSTRVAEAAGVGNTGAFAPLWSADARYIAFVTTDNHLLIADRQGNGQPAAASGAAGTSVLRAAWNGSATTPVLAAISGRTLEIYNPQGAVLAALDADAGGSPQTLLWQRGDGDNQLLAVSYAGTASGTTVAVFEYSISTHRLTLSGAWPADDGAPLLWLAP